MLRDNLLNFFMNARKGSPFSCLTLRRARYDMWCDWLVANRVLNLANKVLKLSTESNGC